MGLQPGRIFAKSVVKSPLKPVPSGSLPSPTVAVKGEPVVWVMMLPSCHPPARFETNADDELGDGRFQMKLPTSTFRISKSQAPTRADFTRSNGTAMEVKYVSPVTGAELVSRHLPNVYDNCP